MHPRKASLVALAAFSTLACGQTTPGLPQSWAEAVEPELPPALDPSSGAPDPDEIAVHGPSVLDVQVEPQAPLGGVAPGTLGYETFESVTLPGRTIAEAPPAGPEIDTGAPAPSPGFRAGALCTYTAVQLGSTCTEDPSGGACLLADHFAELFGTEGLLVGGVKSVTFSGPEAVRRGLPGRGPAAALTGSLRDPAETELGALASELVTLAVNLSLSDAGLGGAADLSAARVTHGIVAGWTVEAVFEAAQRLLAGEPQPFTELGHDAAAVATAIAQINGAAPACAGTGLLTR
jgi:hypothetical protein